MAIYLGIDPGAKGSLCVLDTNTKVMEFMDTPGGSITPRVLHNWILDLNSVDPIHIIGIENVHAIFGTSAKSNFSFGFNVGMLHGIAGISGIGIDLIQPKEWQKGVGVPAQKPKTAPAVRKKAIAEVALRLYPNAPLFGPRGGLHDGRSDSLMIAHYLSIKYGSTP